MSNCCCGSSQPAISRELLPTKQINCILTPQSLQSSLRTPLTSPLRRRRRRSSCRLNGSGLFWALSALGDGSGSGSGSGSRVAARSEESFYELLGLSGSVGFPEIKQAYKQMALKYHPDVSPTVQLEENTQIFIRVHEAYEILSDPLRRALYDRDLALGFHLAFTTRHFNEELEAKSQWRNRWQGQVAELKRSMNNDSGENMSWGTRMCKQRNSSSEV